jgi:ATP-dependent Lon protease
MDVQQPQNNPSPFTTNDPVQPTQQVPPTQPIVEEASSENRISLEDYLVGSNNQTNSGTQPLSGDLSIDPETTAQIEEPSQTEQAQSKLSEVTTDALTTTEVLSQRDTSQNNLSEPKVRDEQDDHSIKTNSNQSVASDGDAEVIAEIEELQTKVDASDMPDELRQRAERSIQRLRRMAKRGSYTGEFETVEKYIYWITNIPWGKRSTDNLEVSNAKRIMDQSHYGMNTVKNLVLDYLAVMQLQLSQGSVVEEGGSQDMAVLRGSSANAPVMIFVGLQGVGKTSIAKSIANSMGREFQRVAVGAIGSVQALRGQSKAFLDAEPGGIVKALVRSQSMNPVILLDEIDKASGNSGLLNDIMAALLEILDPEQNSTFVDHYIDYPVDLSNIFFICTANNLGSLSAALLDRMEVIRFTSYSDDEKIVIAKNYSMPKVIKNSGLGPNQIVIDDAVWPVLVRPVGFDAGLRQLERNLATMVRSAARRIVEGQVPPIVITVENVREFVLPDQGPLS